MSDTRLKAIVLDWAGTVIDHGSLAAFTHALQQIAGRAPAGAR